MRQALLLLICLTILFTGCSSDKDAPENVAPKEVVNIKRPAVGINEETAIPTTLENILDDVFAGEGTKWIDKWIRIEAEVSDKNENSLNLSLPINYARIAVCSLRDDYSDPQVHKYEVGGVYTFDARAEIITEALGGILLMLTFSEADYFKDTNIDLAHESTIVTTYLETLVNEVMEGQLHKWIGKWVRFRAEVSYKSEKRDRISVRTARDSFTIFIEGFNPKSNDFQKYKKGQMYTFTVKIKTVSGNGRGGYTLTASLTGL